MIILRQKNYSKVKKNKENLNSEPRNNKYKGWRFTIAKNKKHQKYLQKI